MNTMRRKSTIFVFLICLIVSLVACTTQDANSIYTILNDNVPEFAENEITTECFETYSKLDSLGRCGVAFACIGKDLMPTEERGAIGQVKPSGWKLAKYDIVDGKYLYNRCHLIGYQLSGENANERNLITGTRYFNTEGMLPFENEVAQYVKKTGNHVMYRVTPVFDGLNLVAKGVQMEAYSVEDDGEGVSFNVFVNNIQPGIEIDYADGTSRLIDVSGSEDSKEEERPKKSYPKGDKIFILNTNTKKFHEESCSSVKDISSKNKEAFNGDRAWLEDNGYVPCGKCNP